MVKAEEDPDEIGDLSSKKLAERSNLVTGLLGLDRAGNKTHTII